MEDICDRGNHNSGVHYSRGRVIVNVTYSGLPAREGWVPRTKRALDVGGAYRTCFRCACGMIQDPREVRHFHLEHADDDTYPAEGLDLVSMGEGDTDTRRTTFIISFRSMVSLLIVGLTCSTVQ